MSLEELPQSVIPLFNSSTIQSAHMFSRLLDDPFYVLLPPEGLPSQGHIFYLGPLSLSENAK